MVIIIKSNLRIRNLHGNFSCVHTADKQTLQKYRCWTSLTPTNHVCHVLLWHSRNFFSLFWSVAATEIQPLDHHFSQAEKIIKGVRCQRHILAQVKGIVHPIIKFDWSCYSPPKNSTQWTPTYKKNVSPHFFCGVIQVSKIRQFGLTQNVNNNAIWFSTKYRL